MSQRQWVESLLFRYEKKLITYAYKIIGNLEISKEVAQESFIKLLKQPKSAVEGKEEQWLFRVCRNHCIDILRKNLKDSDLTDDQTMEMAPSTPFDVLNQKDTKETLRKAVDSLTKKQQELIFLKYHLHKSYKEISDITGYTQSNVGYILSEAMENLRLIFKTQKKDVFYES